MRMDGAQVVKRAVLWAACIGVQRSSFGKKCWLRCFDHLTGLR